MKPPSAVSDTTPPELYRWGNQEGYEANLWLQAQPPMAETVVDADDWATIQRRLEELGVFVDLPLAGQADIDE